MTPKEPKSLDDRTESSQLKSIGLTTAIFLVVANMIGSGVFTTSGFSLGGLGSPHYVFLAWLVGGMIAITGAICYGALGKHFRKSGGEYLFLTRTIHPAAGFIAGWASLVAGFTGAIAFSAKTFAAYFLPIVNASWTPQSHPQLFLIVACSVIAIAALAHMLRFDVGIFAQNILVSIKLLMLAILIAVALLAPDAPFDRVVSFNWGEFAVSVMYVSFSYAGYNAVVYAASEVRNVERILPRATFLGTALVTALYLLLNYVFVYKVPIDLTTNQNDIAAICAQHVGGPWLEFLTRVIISLATLTSVFAMVMLGPRVIALMAEDGWMPSPLKVPTTPAALGLQGFLAIIVVYIFSIYANASDLLLYIGMTLSLSSALSVSSLFVLRAHGEKVSVPLWPLPPIIFIAATLVLIITAAIIQPVQIAFTAGVIVVGLIVFAILYRR